MQSKKFQKNSHNAEKKLSEKHLDSQSVFRGCGRRFCFFLYLQVSDV